MPNITFQNGPKIDEEDILFAWSRLLGKYVKSYFQAGPLSEVVTIANLPHAASRILTSAESTFWLLLTSLNDDNQSSMDLHDFDAVW